jgi:hypothetical protein
VMSQLWLMRMRSEHIKLCWLLHLLISGTSRLFVIHLLQNLVRVMKNSTIWMYVGIWIDLILTTLLFVYVHVFSIDCPKNSLMHSASAITVSATAIFHYYKEMLASAVITFRCMINISQTLSSYGHPHGRENKNANTIIICQNHSTG